MKPFIGGLVQDLSEVEHFYGLVVVIFPILLEVDITFHILQVTKLSRKTKQPSLLEPGLQSSLESKIQCFPSSFFPSLIPCGLSPQMPRIVPAFSGSGASGDPFATLYTLHSESQTQGFVSMSSRLAHMKLPIIGLSERK